MSYEKIVKDRSYLLQKNQEQISSILALDCWRAPVLESHHRARSQIRAPNSQSSADSPDIPCASPTEAHDSLFGPLFLLA